MLSINTNLSSLIAQNSLSTSTNKLNQAIERMSTGLKINHASDNAANYSISTNMTTRIGAYEVAEDNTEMGLDMITTASESLSQIETALNRLRTLAIQSSNGTYGAQSQSAINSEANALVDEISRIYNTNEYNGIKMTSSEESKFIKDIDRRDTSKMNKLSSIEDESVALTSGTYSISTADELERLARMTNDGKIGADTEFVLANDINLGHIDNWTSIGNSTNPFQASFDGNGYKISEITITGDLSYQGLFGNTTGTTIENIGLENININGKHRIGSLAGKSTSNISNCYCVNAVINATGDYAGGLIGVSSDIVKDSYSISEVKGDEAIGGLIGQASGIIKNCFTNCNVSGNITIGGLAGSTSGVLEYTLEIDNCITKGSVKANTSVAGGLIGTTNVDVTIRNSSTTADLQAISGTAGGVIGVIYRETVNIENCDSMGTISIATYKGAFVGTVNTSPVGKVGTLKNCSYGDYYKNNNVSYVRGTSNDTYANSNITYLEKEPFEINVNGTIYNSLQGLSLQIGVQANESSSLGIKIDYSVYGVNKLRNIGIDTTDYLSQIDDLLLKLSAKQTEYGSAQNRLMSVLDEIQIQKENLISSRSTMRDADMAEVSSTYIQQQILQQASATLMSTANQAPAIALRLLQGF